MLICLPGLSSGVSCVMPGIGSEVEEEDIVMKNYFMRPLSAFLPVAVVALAVVGFMARSAAGQTTLVGSPAVVEGTVAMLVEDDFANGRATRRYYLDQSGLHGRYELKLTAHQATIVEPGMQVRVTGSMAGRVLSADPAEHAVVVLEAPVASGPLAARKVLVLLVDIDRKSVV